MEITRKNYFELKSQKLLRREIAEKFNVPEWKLKKIIAKEGWGAKRPTIKNLKAFTQEDELDYYWAGFIAADGNISDKNDLYVCLHHKDKNHLEKLLSFLDSNHAISENTDTYNRAQIGLRLPEEMAKVLKTKFNIVPRKSLIYQLPNITNSDNFRHYLRGYFDGDGSVGEYFNNENSILSSISCNITGSNTFITDLYNFLSDKGLGGHKYKRKDSDVSVISFKTTDTEQLLKFMYNNCNVFLDRKYTIYKKIYIENRRKYRKGNSIINDR